VVRPRSHCRNCDHLLPWWENVPLLSWLLLLGRCRACREWIGWRYPIVEAAVGVGWGLIAFHCFPGSDLVPVRYAWTAAIYALSRMIFLWLLIALAVLDFEHFWLPDKITIPGTLIGFAATLLYAAVDFAQFLGHYGAFGLRSSVLGAWHRLIAILLAAGFLLLIRWLYWLFRRREGLGLGDVKLMAMIAAWLGLRGAFLALVIAVLLGTLAALAVLVIPALRRDPDARWSATPLPFGTFLSIGGIVSSLWSAQIVSAYLHWAGF
jgi:leader peptidase (prepilin peptidase)/N-methyltransferase